MQKIVLFQESGHRSETYSLKLLNWKYSS